MIVTPLNAALPSSPVNKTAKTAKVSKRGGINMESETDEASAGNEPVRLAVVKHRAPDSRNAPKSAMAMSSNAVLSALLQLKPGG